MDLFLDLKMTQQYKINIKRHSATVKCKMFIFDEKYGCTGTEKFILN